MKATRFEYEHQVLLHLFLLGLATLSYVHDPLDIVWALVRNHSDSAYWERLVFGVGTLMLTVSAGLETWVNAHSQNSVGRNRSEAVIQPQPHQLLLARILLVLTVGLFLPLSGTIILLTGEAILVLRLFLRNEESTVHVAPSSSAGRLCWRSGFRIAASKWGLTASMIAFVWTLQDRVAEIGATCSVVLWLLLNYPVRNRSASR